MTPIFEPGTILLGKYRVEKLLGQGAMGYVVAARHEFLGELHALKLMQPEALRNADAVERFMREARAYARLKSDHAVRVHDFGRLDDGAPFIAMEHLEGEDLQEILDAQKVFPFQDAALYVLQACDALAEAHALGIVHRDLKPSNLFLTRRTNGTPCVKVLDFGISKALDDAANSSPKLTATNTVMGTAYYMSPEQVRNSKATDHRGDIWALGVILYEFATGRVPFDGENFFDISSSAVNSQHIPPSQLRPSIPADFDYIVSRCLEKLPEMRFQSVTELAAALQRLVGADMAPSVVAVPELTVSTKIHVDGDVDVDKDTATHKHSSHLDDSNETLVIPPSKSESVIPAAPSTDSDEPLPSPGVANSFAKVFLREQAERIEAQRIKRRRETAKKVIIFVIGTGALIWGVNFYETKGKPWLSDFRARHAIASASATASASSDEPPLASETIAAFPSASAPTHPTHRAGNATKPVTNTGTSSSAAKAAPSAESPSAAKSANATPSAAAPSSSVTAPAVSAVSPTPGPKTDPKSGSVEPGEIKALPFKAPAPSQSPPKDGGHG